MLHNTLDGSVSGADYTVNLEGRDDDKRSVSGQERPLTGKGAKS